MSRPSIFIEDWLSVAVQGPSPCSMHGVTFSCWYQYHPLEIHFFTCCVVVEISVLFLSLIDITWYSSARLIDSFAWVYSLCWSSDTRCSDWPQLLLPFYCSTPTLSIFLLPQCLIIVTGDFFFSANDSVSMCNLQLFLYALLLYFLGTLLAVKNYLTVESENLWRKYKSSINTRLVSCVLDLKNFN